MRTCATAATVLLTACQPKPALEPVAVRAGATCDATTLGNLIGKPRSDGLRAVALKRSGASVARWLPPGTITTMDYRPDRLNIELGDTGTITRFRCG